MRIFIVRLTVFLFRFGLVWGQIQLCSFLAHSAYSYLCTQGSHLTVFKGPYGVSSIQSELVACKTSTLHTILLLKPKNSSL